MDGTRALFKKIMTRDRSSFETLSENYGWKLYSYIRRNSPDKETAERVFSDTFSRFYDTLENYQGDDPIEAMLYACADDVSVQKTEDRENGSTAGQWSIGHEAGFALPEVDLKKYEKKKEPLGIRIFYGICIALLILGILAALWIMVWMLMSMNLIPYLDLGYSWFNAHIANLF